MVTRVYARRARICLWIRAGCAEEAETKNLAVRAVGSWKTQASFHTCIAHAL